METEEDMAVSVEIVPKVEESVPQLFQRKVDELSEKVVIREKDFGIWNEYTWSDWGEQAQLIGLGLKALGLQRGDTVSIASEVNKEWMYADLGSICIGAVCNGVYPTDAPNQVEYLINDSETKFYFAEDEEQLDKVLRIRERVPTLKKVIIFDMEGLRNLDDDLCMSLESLCELGIQYRTEHPDAWSEEIHASDIDDLMILTYTSGTTGPPKGAMITQRNMRFMMNCAQNCFSMSSNDRQLGFLPLAHIAGRMFYVFAVIQAESEVHLVESLETMNNDIQEVEPTVHFAVPRVWEKQYSAITIMRKDSTALGQWAYDQAISVGYRRASFLKESKKIPLGLAIYYAFFNFAVLRNVRRALGIDQCRWLATAAAPIAPDLIEWYWALGRPMYELYGQTECTGLATCNVESAHRIGSVGRAIKDVEVELSEDDEILIRSPGVIRGYWKQPEKTADTIRQGWLYTGDVGRIDDDGYVYIVDRMKDILITAGGKNITPSEIENQLKFSPYITDAVVVGDRRPYLTCLIMIDHENVTHFAQDNDVPFTNYTSLCHTTEVTDLIGKEVDRVNSMFAQVETIKKFRLIDQLLDAEDEELTPTQKLKRKVVNEKYSSLIDQMYSGG